MMDEHESQFELPKRIDHYIGALSKLYAQEGQREKQEIIVNAQIRVVEGWSYDRWNGGTYGHALYLTLPESLYLSYIRQKDDLQNQIREDIAKVHNLQNEFIQEVFLEMLVKEDEDWRRDSGLLQQGRIVVSSEATKRIWENDGFRVFLSHKAEVRKQAGELKAGLRVFGISSFVAHEDIHPTKEWQEEIENALSSMDAFVALMTERFHESLWTDQEVGFAIGRNMPIIAVRLGRDPYGFIGKFQALSCDWLAASNEITKILIKHERMLNAYIAAVKNCGSWDRGNKLAEILPNLTKLSGNQRLDLIAAFNQNSEVRGSFGFNGRNPFNYGEGLVHHLNRLTGIDHSLVDGRIVSVG
jgi:hypothetical protein